ncbi:hypothetical protein ACFU5B_18930 [Streptomyces murinus]|uniref:hypothetical protein n=1 Tax=Streptomyces murinus TaxID=33900 RepID=UPI003638D163
MDRRSPEDPASALLDLLRAYTHDCLHYGSRRRYVEVAGVPVRTQYGINYRRTGGQSYSAADSHESRSTRNLGIVMEGACDKEARALTHRDATGTLTAEDTDRSATVPGSEEQARYMAALSGYERAVITGDATALGMWLDDRHGPGSFAGLFRTPEYFDA